MKLILEFVLVFLVFELSECFNIPGWEPERARSRIWPNVKYAFPYPVLSPVNITTANAHRRKLNPLKIKFPWESAKEMAVIKNTGYYLEVLLPEEVDSRPYVTGGPLFDEKYIFEQFHFHWGKTDDCGSEHRLDEKCFPTEVHAVFYNEIYGSFEEAGNHADGVAVVAFFGERNLKNTDNIELKYLIGKLSDIIEPGANTTSSFKTEFIFMREVFQQSNYYTFPGSLTTKPYSECVTWIICPKPFNISSSQLEAFRKLKATNGRQLEENIHVSQDFNQRPFLAPMHNSD